MQDNGNVVLGFTSDSVLMLDCDLKREDEVVKFAQQYSRLGSSLVMQTSESFQLDLYGKHLGNYCIIFGKVLDWEEIRWHIGECYRLKMINKGFTALRKFGSITIRVNAKNNRIPHPEIAYYFSNSDKQGRIGIWGFLKHWAICKGLGMLDNSHEENREKCIQDCHRCSLFYLKNDGQSCLDVFSSSHLSKIDDVSEYQE